MTDINVGIIYGIVHDIGYESGYANMLIDNTSIEINNASGEYVCGIAYYIYSHSNVSITSTNIILTDINGNDWIYGIAYKIGSSTNMFVDNISIEINNANGERVYGIAYEIYS